MSDPGIDRSLIDAARDGLGPTREERDRLRRAVGAAIAGATVTGAAASSAAASTTATATTGALALGATWKLAAIALVAVGAIGGATWSATTAPAASEPVPVPDSHPIPDSDSAPVADSEPVPVPEPVPDSPSPPPSVSAPERDAPSPPRPPALAPSPAPSSLLAETRLLRDAHAALRAGTPARALALLDEHATRFPDGALREERLATRIAALCDAGDVATARAETTRFLAAHPRSLHAPRVRAACGATPP